MYTAHFGLTEPPFAITPDPRYLFMSERHREALAHLLYGVGEGGGFVQLTGEVGTGKTTVCRCFLEQLPAHVDAALILNPRLSALELLATVCDELGVAYPKETRSEKVLVEALSRHLLEAHGRLRRTVLVIDEAQDLAPGVLEQVRLLTNLETTKEKLLQVILIGQPELIAILDRQKLRQLAQRVTARYHLAPLSREETRGYIRHRLEVAGRSDAVFSDRAVRLAHRLSGGVPRLINVICDRALLGAYVQDQKHVDAATMRRAVAEVFGRSAPARVSRPLRWASTAVAGVAVVIAVALLYAPSGLPWLAGGVARLGAALPARESPAAPAPPSGLGVPPAGGGEGEAGGARGGSVSLGGPGDAVPPPITTPAGPHPSPPSALPSALADLLRHDVLRADRPAALASLYARWHPDRPQASAGLACERGRLAELVCVSGTGTWKKLRRLNLPAVLELVTPAGEPRYAAVTALAEEHATLELGGRVLTVPLGAVDAFWEGAFTVLWSLPASGPLPITPGTSGKPVRWLQNRLAEVDGQPVTRVPRDVYDDALRSRVVAFQRARALAPDGIVGVETLIQLAAAAREPGIPWLAPPAP